MSFVNEPYFKILDPKSKETILQYYPTGNFRSIVEYKYYPGIRLIVSDYSGNKNVFYL
jgi:hypothetical protein